MPSPRRPKDIKSNRRRRWHRTVPLLWFRARGVVSTTTGGRRRTRLTLQISTRPTTLSVTLAPTQTRPTTSGRIETLNNTSNIKKSQPGSKILRPESTINIHVHVHNHNQIPGSNSMSHITCNVKFFQPGSKILRTESDNRCHVAYWFFPARIKNSQNRIRQSMSCGILIFSSPD